MAYVDESMRAAAGDKPGLYLLAAAVIDIDGIDTVRTAVAALATRRRRFHWRPAEEEERSKAIATVAGLDAIHLLVLGTPLDPVRQERARRQCMRRLLFELDAAGVGQVWLETRTQTLNTRDLAAIAAWRSQLVVGPGIRVDHAYPSTEPLLWVPDIVAGAVGAAYAGEADYRSMLEPLIVEYKIILD